MPGIEFTVPKITTIRAREILDSRGRPTVEVDVVASDGSKGRSSAPAGASVGKHEAPEHRDGEKASFAGKGVLKAVGVVNDEVAKSLRGMDLDDQGGIDAALVAIDGLGSNASWGVSMAAAKAAAKAGNRPLYEHLNRIWKTRLGPDEPAEPTLPMPMVTMISGGEHAGHNLDFQCFCLVPIGAEGLRMALEMSTDMYRCLGEALRAGGEGLLVGDTGAYGPSLRMGVNAVKKMLEAVLSCGHKLGEEVAVALDVAASHLFDEDSGRYHLKNEGEFHDAEAFSDLLAYWTREFPIVSIEDPLGEDDWGAWTRLTARIGGSIQIAGDDLFATRADRLRSGIDRKAANAVVIHPNAVGTLSETLDAMALARVSGFRTIVSARSGETEDTSIADLAVATAAGQVKFGSMARSERLAKYNRLLRIEEEMGSSATYAGRAALGL